MSGPWISTAACSVEAVTWSLDSVDQDSSDASGAGIRKRYRERPMLQAGRSDQSHSTPRAEVPIVCGFKYGRLRSRSGDLR